MAIIKIRNTAIDLDAAEIPNIDASKITSGSIADARIPNLDASKITTGSIADARIPASAVSQHASSFDDNAIVNDLSTLALRQATNENAVAYNTNSQFIDVFQDSSAINLTNVTNVSEYLASVYENKIQFIPSLHRTSTHTGALATAGWTGGENTANSSSTTSSSYEGIIVNELWDLSGDWQCNTFIGSANQDGALGGQPYCAFSMIFTTNTSLTAGSDPDIFSSATAHTSYGSDASQFQGSNFLTSAGRTGMNVSDLSNSGKFQTFVTSAGTGAKSYDAGGTTFGIWGYYNDTTSFAGFQCIYDKSASTIVFRPRTDSGSLPNHGVTTISNVPSSGRAIVLIGDATSQSRNFQTSYLNGSRTNDDFSYKTSSVVNATGIVESNAITAPSSTNKMGAIITYQDNAGTNALNTDIVLQLSADGGSNYTTATLTALPDFSTGIKMCKVNDLTIGTAGTSLKYKISFANQALGSKEARIRGVSLQY